MFKVSTKDRAVILIELTMLVGALFLATNGQRAVAASIVVPEGAKAGTLTDLKPCAYQAPGSKTIFEAQCATLAVPENWDKAGSRLIALPVVRIPATGPNPAEPVFWLVGGPGGSNLSWTPPDWILEKHDVVMVGYRGADGSVQLWCPELGSLMKEHAGVDLFSDQARSEYVAASRQCAADLESSGVDLAGYTIPGVVEDTDAARLALGYERIDLFSESYGTRVAEIYAYLHPDSLKRVVMVGVNTPGHFIWDPAVYDKMIQHLSDLCAADASCSSRTNNLAETMYTVNRNLPKSWLFLKIDPDTVRLGSQFLLFSNKQMPTILDAYLAAGEGDASGLALGNLIAKMMLPTKQWILGDYLSKGGTADLDKYRGLESISLGNSTMGAPLSELIWPMIDGGWPFQLIPENLRNFQESDVEMLLVNGTIDFSTPPNALEEAKPYYHKAQMVLLPEFGHVEDEYTEQTGAFERLITSYYDTGVGDSSLYVYQPLSFKAEMSMVVMAKVLAAALILVPALIILGVVLIVRRIRRRRMMQSLAAQSD